MLLVGLTGGIGSGKSTAAARLVERGAVLVDADAIAREVVAPGSDGLAEVVAAFGAGVLAPDGTLDRPKLASVVFGDDAARARLNAIVHPRVRRRSAEVQRAAPADAVVVQDVPLLVEGGMAPQFALVVVVHAEVDERVRRLVGRRGMAEADVRARIAAQADDAARRAAADVWLPNEGAPADLAAAVDRLWDGRLVPFEENLRARRPAPWSPDRSDPDPEWAAAADRLAARVAAAAGEHGHGVAHVGPTAVPSLPAPDVVDLQLGVASGADADAVRERLQEAGFPAAPEAGGEQRRHGSADPGRPARLHIRPIDSPGWRHALLLRDWLRADSGARAEYLQVGDVTAGDSTDGSPPSVEPTQPWSESAAARAEAWAATSRWVPSLA